MFLAVDPERKRRISHVHVSSPSGATTFRMQGLNENGYLAKLSAQGVGLATRTGSRGATLLPTRRHVYRAGELCGTNAFATNAVIPRRAGRFLRLASTRPATGFGEKRRWPGLIRMSAGVDYAGNALVAGWVWPTGLLDSGIAGLAPGAGNLMPIAGQIPRPQRNYLWVAGGN
jgi:hypothetical protein